MWQPIAKLYTPMQTVFVITVCWNAVNLIEETIKSVLSQTYQDVKYLIIDGGSTDGTVDIIKKYEDKLTYWVSEPDNGIYDAMNKGLTVARSIANKTLNPLPLTLDPNNCWVNYMNAGDTFAGNSVLEEIFSINAIGEEKLVVGGHANLVYKNKIDVLYAQSPDAVRHQLPYCHQSAFVKLLLNGDPWSFETKYKIAADYKVFYDIYYKFGADAYQTVDVIVANYRMEDSMTFNNLKKAKGEYLSIQAGHRDWQWWKEYIKWRCL